MDTSSDLNRWIVFSDVSLDEAGHLSISWEDVMLSG